MNLNTEEIEIEFFYQAPRLPIGMYNNSVTKNQIALCMYCTRWPNKRARYCLSETIHSRYLITEEAKRNYFQCSMMAARGRKRFFVLKK